MGQHCLLTVPYHSKFQKILRVDSRNNACKALDKIWALCEFLENAAYCHFSFHCNYGGVHLNTAGSKILAENFILAFSEQTWLGIVQDNDALIENVSETESNSEIAKYLHEDYLESKSDNHDNDENHGNDESLFSFLEENQVRTS